MRMKLSLSGPAGAGKDFLADILVRRHRFIRFSFAQPLKECAGIITGLSPSVVDDVKEGKMLPGKQAAMRKLLQYLGTEVGREIWGENVWVDNLLRRVHSSERCRAVVTDCRFRNEFDALKTDGFFMVYVNCPDEFNRLKGDAAKHPSETDLLPYAINNKFDTMLWNDRKTPPEALIHRILAE